MILGGVMTWMVVVYYDGKPENYTFVGETAEADARRMYADRCVNWSCVYLLQVIEGPECPTS